MKEFQRCNRSALSSHLVVLFSVFVVAASVLSVHAQPAPTDAEVMNRRLVRARALSAAHDLKAAALELDAIRTSTTDDVTRDVARIMLMGIYLEEADYARAQNLLDETQRARARQNEGSCRSYFAVAGQAVNGIRAHLERFRALGLNISSRELPAEAVNDLDRVRSLLEHVAEQAIGIGAEDKKNTDAFALLEDVANVRSSLARDSDERLHWQGEVANAREHLAASENRLASLSGGVAVGGVSPASTSARSRQTTTPATSEVKAKAPPPASAEESQKKKTVAVDSNDLSSSPATGRPVNVGSLLEQATHKVNPSYPAFAKTAHVTGIVRVEIVVDENGSVVSAQSSTGPSVLRLAAIDASRHWKFRPRIIDGHPVRVVGFLNFNFATQ